MSGSCMAHIQLVLISSSDANKISCDCLEETSKRKLQPRGYEKPKSWMEKKTGWESIYWIYMMTISYSVIYTSGIDNYMIPHSLVKHFKSLQSVFCKDILKDYNVIIQDIIAQILVNHDWKVKLKHWFWQWHRKQVDRDIIWNTCITKTIIQEQQMSFYFLISKWLILLNI